MSVRRVTSWFGMLAAGLVAAGFAGSGSSGAASVHAAIQAPSSLLTPGQITFCSDISGPPFESYAPNGKPVGSDVQLGDALAKLMGVKAIWRNTNFAGIIPALEAKQCDAILSGMVDKPARRKVVDFVDYLKIGASVVVPSANPHHVKGIGDLSGLTVAVEIGTNLKATLDAENAKYKAEGKPPMQIEAFPQDTAAFQQLEVGHVDAYFTATPTAQTLIKKSGFNAKLVGPQVGASPFGIATTKDNKALHAAFAKGLARLRASGEYRKILARFDLAKCCALGK